MIIVKLKGGLGNQLFQYAAAKALALQLGVPFYIDESIYHKKKNYRKPEIFKLHINATIASTKQINSFVKSNWMYNRKPNWIKDFFKNVYQENGFTFNQNFFNLTSPIYLDGYFQSEKYFKNIKEILIKEFQIKNDYVENCTDLKQKIKQSNAVAVHIRRGDYLLPQFAKIHGALTESYYQKAINLIDNQVENPVFYIFSDDINWAKENLVFSNEVIFASEFTNSALEDFYLMSQCKHNIVANSSFSWWAAWLNPNTEKIVYAPKNWFADKSIDSSDLIPTIWNLI